MSASPRSVTVQTPGSTSNLGPGFDCLGVALRLYNRVTVTLEDGPEPPPMASETARRFFAEIGQKPFPFAWSISGDVPISRGLGSSVTLRQGVLQGLNELVGQPLSQDDLFRLGAELEGHPDNASAGVYGGFTCSNASGRLLRFEVAEELKFVLLIPDLEVLTEDARRCLPNRIPHKEAVRTLGNACMITAAFASQRYDLLRGGFWDGLHQPYREKVNPGLNEAIAAGESAGALGGFLSGSGSTICCLTLTNAEEIGRAMLEAYQPFTFGKAQARVVQAANDGATTVAQE